LITNAVKFTSRKNGERKIIVSMGASIERPTSYPPNVIYFSQDQEMDSFHVDSTMSSEWGEGDPLYLMVAVKDTGIGISQEGQLKLFERFRFVLFFETASVFAKPRTDKLLPRLKRTTGALGLACSFHANVTFE
jgi:hypothetical protein